MTSDRLSRDDDAPLGGSPLDEAARRAHAAALDRLSPRVRAQLAQRRRAALAGDRPRATRAWPMLAMGSAAVLALAVGLFALRTPDPGAAEASAPLATRPAAAGPAATPPAATTPAADPAPEAVAMPAPALAAHAPSEATDATDVAEVTEVVAVDALPEDWLAASFAPADEAAGFDALEENPDFYLWLGSDEGLAELTEAL